MSSNDSEDDSDSDEEDSNEPDDESEIRKDSDEQEQATIKLKEAKVATDLGILGDIFKYCERTSSRILCKLSKDERLENLALENYELKEKLRRLELQLSTSKPTVDVDESSSDILQIESSKPLPDGFCFLNYSKFIKFINKPQSLSEGIPQPKF